MLREAGAQLLDSHAGFASVMVVVAMSLITYPGVALYVDAIFVMLNVVIVDGGSWIVYKTSVCSNVPCPRLIATLYW